MTPETHALPTERFLAPVRLTTALKAVAAAGALFFLAGLAISPARALRGYLVAEVYLTGLGVGAAVFLALQHLTRAGWSIAFRRVPEAMAGTLPVAALAFVPVLLGAHGLYEWTHKDVVARDALLAAKSAWLNVPFFALRAALYFGLWILLTRAMIARSRRQDLDGAIDHTLRNGKLAALFLVVFGVTFSAASFDWVMSLAPHWYSTIYAVYQWAGAFVSSLAAIVLLLVMLRRAGTLRGVVTDEHLFDLGRLMAAFSTFWAYMWFSQYMLVWYSNIPEETVYYLSRTKGPWMTLFIVNLVVNWVVPFLALLPRPAKRSERTLARVAALLLCGRFLDLYMDICHPAMGAGPSISPFEVAPVVGAVALFGLVFLRAFAQAPPVPVRDPLLEESLHHHA